MTLLQTLLLLILLMNIICLYFAIDSYKEYKRLKKNEKLKKEV